MILIFFKLDVKAKKYKRWVLVILKRKKICGSGHFFLKLRKYVPTLNFINLSVLKFNFVFSSLIMNNGDHQVHEKQSPLSQHKQISSRIIIHK